MSPTAWTWLLAMGVVMTGGLPVTISLVRNTRGPRERAYVVRSVLWAWGGLALAIAAAGLFPGLYSYGLLALYLLQLPVLAYRMTLRQILLRRSEGER